MIDKCSAKHHYLKKYKNRLWDLLESFDALKFTTILDDQNSEVHAVAQKGSRFDPTHYWLKRKGI